MADKLINQLQLLATVTDDLQLPCDNSIQSYRVTALQLKNFIISVANQSAFVPSGAVVPFAGVAEPTGYYFCDGSTKSRTTDAALFAAIGVSHGSGDGSTTFNLPDYRGRLLRGVDGAQGRDPDRATRTAMNAGGATGDNVGSIQGHAFQTHTHIQQGHKHGIGWGPQGQAIGTAPAGTAANLANGNQTNNLGNFVTTNYGQNYNLMENGTAVNNNATASGTHAQASVNETRPVNAYVNYLIKA